jgi:hypothetical protein
MKARMAMLALGGVFTAQPVVAKPDQAATIMEAAGYCSISTPVEQSLSLMESRGWKDATPVMFGQSMARITGAIQFRRKGASAMINTSEGVAGRNCQFDFSDVPDSVRDTVVAALTQKLGPYGNEASGFVTWNFEGNSLSIGQRSPNSLTLLWLPTQTQKAGN